MNPSKQESITVDTVKKVDKLVVRPLRGKAVWFIMLAEAQVISSHVSDVVKTMQVSSKKGDGIRRDTLVPNAFPNKPQPLAMSS